MKYIIIKSGIMFVKIIFCYCKGKSCINMSQAVADSVGKNVIVVLVKDHIHFHMLLTTKSNFVV